MLKRAGDKGRWVADGNVIRIISIFFAVAFLVIYCRGLIIPLMHNDSAHHANIAMHMYNSGDYVSLIDRDSDYIDKPHFLFWTAALSYHLFGITPFAYKFPTFLFGLLGVYATYRIALLLYDAATAWLSVAILVSSYSFMLSFNDVRMDAILAAAITFSIWQLLMLSRDFRIQYVLGAALGLAVGFSTKGMIGIVVPAVAFLSYVVSQKTWKQLFSMRWFFTAICTVLFMAPVIYCYYLQFDLHSEKSIDGVTGVSGVKFILFGQTFQRVYGQEGMPSAGDPFFYLHTFLWAFLPWSLMAVVAWYKTLIGIFRGKNMDAGLFLFSTFTFVFMILSITSSKLPHYLNIILPLTSIMTAAYLKTVNASTWRIISIVQNVVSLLILLLVGIIIFYLMPVSGLKLGVFMALTLFVIWTILEKRFSDGQKSIVTTLMVCVLLFSVLNFHLFPEVMKYQAGENLSEVVKEKNIDTWHLYFLQGFETSNDFDFALKRNISTMPAEALRARSNVVIVTGQEGLNKLKELNLRLQVVGESPNYRVSRLNFKFLNRETRPSQLNAMYLVSVN